jgi:hypothetical protein
MLVWEQNEKNGTIGRGGNCNIIAVTVTEINNAWSGLLYSKKQVLAVVVICIVDTANK